MALIRAIGNRVPRELRLTVCHGSKCNSHLNQTVVSSSTSFSSSLSSTTSFAIPPAPTTPLHSASQPSACPRSQAESRNRSPFSTLVVTRFSSTTSSGKSKEELIEELAKDPEAKMILEELLKKEFISKNNENSPAPKTSDGKTGKTESSGKDQSPGSDSTSSPPSNLDKPGTDR